MGTERAPCCGKQKPCQGPTNGALAGLILHADGGAEYELALAARKKQYLDKLTKVE